MKKNPNIGSTVFVIDDDASLRAALKELFESIGLQVELFGSGESFLERKHSQLDVLPRARYPSPGMSGLKCQEELAKAKVSIPIIFLTGHGDIPMAVRAMKSGAVDFLTKPFRNQDLLDAVAAALEQDRARRTKEESHSTLRESFKSLSQRERDVVIRVASGGLNKQIAADLGVSEVTVKVHRANAMRKLRVKSVAELVRIIDLMGIEAPARGKLTRCAASPRSSLTPLRAFFQKTMLNQNFRRATKLAEGKPRALGNVEKAVVAVGQIEHPQERHLRALVCRREQPLSSPIAARIGVKIAECDIALEEIDRLEQRAERVGKMRWRHEAEIVGRRMVLLVFAMRRAAEASDGKIEARRAVLPLVIAVRREVPNLEGFALAAQDAFDRPVDIGSSTAGCAYS